MYYPIFLNVKGRPCLVVGNDKEAIMKVRSLREAGARVTHLKRAAIASAKKAASKSFLVVVSTPDRSFNHSIAREVIRTNRLVNVVDDPEFCNFIYPSRFERGPLQIAVSTGGASPVLARHIRKSLEKQYGSAWGKFLVFLAEQRSQVLRKVGDRRERHRLLTMAASPQIADLIRSGRVGEAKKKVKKILEKI